MLRIVLLQCMVGFAQTFTPGENCESLPLLVESIAKKDHTSLAAQCRRHFGLKDCEQLILSVGRGHFSPQVQQRTCEKIANLLQSRNLMDTPLDKVAAVKDGPEHVDVATVSPDATVAPVATLPEVELATVAPLPEVELPTVGPMPEVELATVGPLPQVELPTVAPLPQAELPTVAPMQSVQIATVAPNPVAVSAKVSMSAGQDAESAPEERHQAQPASPELLDALGQTFVDPSAELTPEQRRGDEDEDRPSWLARTAERSADQARPIADALRGAANSFAKSTADREHTEGGEADGTGRQPTQDRPSWLARSAERSADQARPIADALRGAAKSFFKGAAEREHTGGGEADGTSRQSAEEQSWQKEQSFHDRGPFGMNLNNFISSHASDDPSAEPALAPSQEFGGNGGQADAQWMESKFDLRRRVADSATHKMLIWSFLFVALVSLASSLVIRCRPTSAPAAYSRLEAQVPYTSSRQIRVA